MFIEPLQPALALLGALGPDSGPLQSETDCVPGTFSDKADESVLSALLTSLFFFIN